MLAISCPSCPHLIPMTAAGDRPPPWCPRCGADLKPRPALEPPSPALAAEASKKWNDRSEPNPAVTTAPAVVEPLPDDIAVAPIEVPAEPRPTPPLYDERRLLPEPPAPKVATPPWANLFAIACGLIPLLTLGGAIPMVLGMGGASGCLAVGRNKEMDVTLRIGVCAGITVGCWVALFAIINGMLLLVW